MTITVLGARIPGACTALLLGGIAAACSGDSTGPTPSSPGYTIAVRFVGSNPPSQALRDAFSGAQAKWEGIITDSVGSIDIQLDSAKCDSVQPAVHERVKDLLVLVDTRPLSDSTPGETRLGISGPCLIRKPGNLPIIGTMSLNSTAIDQLAQQGMLDEVIVHEMGHLLGFGTIWDLDGFLQDTVSNDPWFSGRLAQAAFRATLPSYTGNEVPLETTGGRATALSHWRESVMTNELMTGFLNSGVNPLSAITIQSMADLGYKVDLSKAEPWPTPSAASARVTGAAELTPGGGAGPQETLRLPRFSVDPSGQVARLSP